jgi:hypothetical protein
MSLLFMFVNVRKEEIERQDIENRQINYTRVCAIRYKIIIIIIIMYVTDKGHCIHIGPVTVAERS